MQVCKNTQCKAKHYDFSVTCSNCNQELPALKARKSHNIYCLVSDHSVTTKKITDKFLNDNADSQGFVELIKNGVEVVLYLKNSKGIFKLCD